MSSNIQMEEEILDEQCRSKKDNLLFYIKEAQNKTMEDCE